MAFTFSYYFNAFLNLKRAEIIKIRIRPNVSNTGSEFLRCEKIGRVNWRKIPNNWFK